jgi:large subunit ribosomal protein L21
MLTKGTAKPEDCCLSSDCARQAESAVDHGSGVAPQPEPTFQPGRPTSPMTSTPAPSEAYAIVETSGQQFWLQPGRYYDVDRIGAEPGSTVSLDSVLLVNDGSSATLGQPFVSGATVSLKVMEHRRGPKIIVYKMRPKKKTRRKNGHRQELTRVMVESITVGSKSFS